MVNYKLRVVSLNKRRYGTHVIQYELVLEQDRQSLFSIILIFIIYLKIYFEALSYIIMAGLEFSVR